MRKNFRQMMATMVGMILHQMMVTMATTPNNFENGVDNSAAK
mgnify:CR=1 FL=1